MASSFQKHQKSVLPNVELFANHHLAVFSSFLVRYLRVNICFFVSFDIERVREHKQKVNMSNSNHKSNVPMIDLSNESDDEHSNGNGFTISTHDAMNPTIATGVYSSFSCFNTANIFLGCILCMLCC